MILVDTSVWIDHLRGNDTAPVQVLQKSINAGEEIAITEPIAMELLAGADTPARADALERLVNGLPSLGIDPRIDFRQAAAIFLAVRRTGRTVRSLTDCLIAAVALRNDIELLHDDRDYLAIADCLPLRCVRRLRR